MKYWARLEGHAVVSTNNLPIGAFKKDRRVASDTVGEADISTVFLALNHGDPDGKALWFETMVFGGEHDQWQDRYETWEQAETGHRRVVAALREGKSP